MSGSGRRRRSRVAAAVVALLAGLPLVGLATGRADADPQADPSSSASAEPAACSLTKQTWSTAWSQGLTQIGITERDPNTPVARHNGTPIDGSGVTVAVVDSGVSATNPHLSGVVVTGRDFTTGVTGGVAGGTTDVTTHGTAVAGIIASRWVRGSSLVGVSPGVRILPVRYYTGNQQAGGNGLAASYSGLTADHLAAALDWAADHARIVVIPASTNLDSPLLRTSVKAAVAKGVLIIASAGNTQDMTSDQDPGTWRYPAAYPGVLSVAAVDLDGATVPRIQGDYIEVAAPGQRALAPYGRSDCEVSPTTASSSYAAAYVAGEAALVAQAYPSDGPVKWAYRIRVTAARPVDSQRDQYLGWGVVHPLAALSFVDDGRALGGNDGESVNPQAVPTQTMPVPPIPTPIDRLRTLRRLVAWLASGVTVVVLAGLLLARLGRRS